MQYGNNRGTEDFVAEHDARGRHECLGLREIAERGRPTLANRWDIELYEEGLPSSRGSDLLGGPGSAVRKMSASTMSGKPR